MRVLEGPFAAWPDPDRPAAVTIGVYDGVHRGHQAVIGALEKRAAARDLALTVVTFRHHPATVLAPDRVPPQLTTLDQRLELLAGLGVDQVALLEFDDELRHLSARDFVVGVLVGGLRARLVSVGEDFRFGFGQSGDVELLAELGAEFDFTVVPIPLVGESGPYAATNVRTSLAAGDLEAVAHALGRPFEIRGVVTEGDRRGRTIGFPTANLALVPHQALPARGVYAVWAEVDGVRVPGVANIGIRPTFDGRVELLEVHLIDAEMDLYGRELVVDFVGRLRGEQKFSGVDALVAQITEDVATARRVLADDPAFSARSAGRLRPKQ